MEDPRVNDEIIAWKSRMIAKTTNNVAMLNKRLKNGVQEGGSTNANGEFRGCSLQLHRAKSIVPAYYFRNFGDISWYRGHSYESQDAYTSTRKLRCMQILGEQTDERYDRLNRHLYRVQRLGCNLKTDMCILCGTSDTKHFFEKSISPITVTFERDTSVNIFRNLLTSSEI